MDIVSLVFGVLFIIIGIVIGYFIGKTLINKEWEEKVKDIRKEAIKKSRAVLGGQFSEQLAPYLPDFPFSPTEARFIGKPIDLIIFKGMDEKQITEVIFVEIKSGKSRLSSHEKKLAEVIKSKKVKWIEYRIPEDITKPKIKEKQ